MKKKTKNILNTILWILGIGAMIILIYGILKIWLHF